MRWMGVTECGKWRVGFFFFQAKDGIGDGSCYLDFSLLPFRSLGSWEGGKPLLARWGILPSHQPPPLFSRGKVGRWESTFGHVGDSPLTRTPPPVLCRERG